MNYCAKPCRILKLRCPNTTTKKGLNFYMKADMFLWHSFNQFSEMSSMNSSEMNVFLIGKLHPREVVSNGNRKKKWE